MFVKACLLLVLSCVGFASTTDSTAPFLSTLFEVPKATYDIVQSTVTDAGKKIFPSLTAPTDRYRRDDTMKKMMDVKTLFPPTMDPVPITTFQTGRMIPTIPSNPRNRRAADIMIPLDSLQTPIDTVKTTVFKTGKMIPSLSALPLGARNRRAEPMMDVPKVVLDYVKTPMVPVKTTTFEAGKILPIRPSNPRTTRTVLYQTPIVNAAIYEPKVLEYPTYDPWYAYYNYYNQYPYYAGYAC